MPPNVLLIVADDLGYGDFGCFNDGLSETPAIDHLAAEGVCLTHHYSASPVCAPARASLLTGRYPHRTGALDTLEARGLDRINLDERTMADLFAAGGYVTGLVGKWHNGAFDDRYHPNQRGFTEFAGFSGGWQDYWDWRLDRDGHVSGGDGRYLTDVLTEEAVEFLRRHRREPFLLWLAYSAPHYPLQAPAEDVARFAESGSFTTGVATVYAMMRAMDRGVARVLDELDQLGLADDTLVLFTSDNGPQFGGFGDESTFRFNCGYAGAKGLVHEGGIRLPMLLRWPAGLDGRREVHDLVHFTDWLPTLLATAGLPSPTNLDGVDVLPVLRGERGQVETTRFWHWNRYRPRVETNAAMRDGDWKLLRPAIFETLMATPDDLAVDEEVKRRPPADIDHSPWPELGADADPAALQLYDLATDPGEQHDLAAEQPGRVARMEADLIAWFEDVTSVPRDVWEA